MWSELHHEAVEIQEQMISRNKIAILNLVSDSTSALTLFGILVQVRTILWAESDTPSNMPGLHMNWQDQG